MRKMIFSLLVLVVVLGLVGVASAGPDRSVIFADCVFTRTPAAIVLTGDTLWYTKDTPNVNAGLFAAQSQDWFGVAWVPTGSKGDGSLKVDRKPVKKALLYSRAPFTYRAYAQGATMIGNAAASTRAVVDTVSSGGGTPIARDTFPCWTVISYPDTLRIYEAGSDSVFVDHGY